MYLNDPKDNKPSVSLTLMVLAGVALTIIGILDVAGVAKTTSVFPEVFYSSVALYFGRRFNISGKVISADKAEEIKEKLE